MRDVLGVFPSGEHGYPPEGVLKETGASGGKEFMTENNVEPPGTGVKATSLEDLSMPTKLASGGANLGVRMIRSGGNSGVVGNKDNAEN